MKSRKEHFAIVQKAAAERNIADVFDPERSAVITATAQNAEIARNRYLREERNKRERNQDATAGKRGAAASIVIAQQLGVNVGKTATALTARISDFISFY